MTLFANTPEAAINDAKRANDEGADLLRRGDLAGAVACFQRALTADPDYPEAFNNLGIVARRTGQLLLAEFHLRRAIELRPDYVFALNNLANTLRETGRPDEAEALYRRAVETDPAYADGWRNLATLLMEQGRRPEALEAFIVLVDLKPDWWPEAEAAMLMALEVAPEANEVRIDLAELYERTNRIDQLRVALADIPADFGATLPKYGLLVARLHRRDKTYAEGLAAVDRALALDVTDRTLETQLLSLKADLHDRVGQYSEAFLALQRCNAASAVMYAEESASKDHYIEHITHLKPAFTPDRIARWVRSDDPPQRLAFMVGFPRSGTTLLDSILRSHPDVDMIEEAPMVAALHDAVRESGRPPIDALDRLTAEEVSAFRNVYLTTLQAHLTPGKANALVIDKLPLSLVQSGLIHRFFPEATFIRVLRDPRDAVLSCYMQTFKPNAAMAHFNDLNDAAKFYDLVFSLWEHYAALLPLKAHTIRYEDYITDFEGEIRPLIHFLGLDWTDELTRYRETALSRPKIQTPSYHQVVQPIYSAAAGRWRNYKDQLAEILPILRPWVEKFGYPAD